MPPSERRDDRPRQGWPGWLIWALFAVAMAAATLLKSDLHDRTVTPEYHGAAMLWWQSKPIYTEGVHGFLYLPQAAVLYSPFALLPLPAEEVLWRLVGIGAYAAGIWTLTRRLFGERWLAAWVWGSLLALPAAIGSAANGQTNLHIAGLFGLATAALIDRRWWWVTLWLFLALACKPTAVVMVLLIGAIYERPMAWRLVLGMIGFVALPFAHPDPGYVVEQYGRCWHKMATAAAPTDLFQDIRGLLVSLGVDEPASALTVLRLDAALATLWMCWLASTRFAVARGVDESGRKRAVWGTAGAVYVLTLGSIYIMLFSPRTEGVTYAILGPVAALWAAREVLAHRWWSGGQLIALCLVLQFSRQVQVAFAVTVFHVLPWLAPSHTDQGGSNYWVRPLATLGLAVLVIAELVQRKDRWRDAAS